MSYLTQFDPASVLAPIEQITPDSGIVVVPLAGNVDILGGNVLTTVGTANTLTINLDNGTDGQLLIGGGANPAWATLISTNATITITGGSNTLDIEIGTLGVDHGGTGATTLTDHGVLVGSGTSPVTPLAVGTDGQVLIGATGADPAFATITSSGGTLSFTPGANTLNMEVVDGAGFTWNEETGTSATMAVNNGYISNNAAQDTFTLPDTAAVGDRVRVVGKGAGGWKIDQNTGESIIWDESSSTTVTTGYLESTDDYDAVELLCITADTTWVVLTAKGNITIV